MKIRPHQSMTEYWGKSGNMKEIGVEKATLDNFMRGTCINARDCGVGLEWAVPIYLERGLNLGAHLYITTPIYNYTPIYHNTSTNLFGKWE